MKIIHAISNCRLELKLWRKQSKPQQSLTQKGNCWPQLNITRSALMDNSELTSPLPIPFQRLGGACRAAYPAVVAGGEAACSIHYTKATQVGAGIVKLQPDQEKWNYKTKASKDYRRNPRSRCEDKAWEPEADFWYIQRLKGNELLLMDAGCEYHGEHLRLWCWSEGEGSDEEISPDRIISKISDISIHQVTPVTSREHGQ